MRKAFFSASITLNVQDSFEVASATKLLSIMNMCVPCPIQFQFYAMIFRLYRQEAATLDHAFSRQKHDWWEYKKLKMIEDEAIEAPNFGKVMSVCGTSTSTGCPLIRDTQIKALVRETCQCQDKLLATLEAFRNETSADETAVATQVREYIAILPSVYN